jgi:hypothetical protein
MLEIFKNSGEFEIDLYLYSTTIENGISGKRRNEYMIIYYLGHKMVGRMDRLSAEEATNILIKNTESITTNTRYISAVKLLDKLKYRESFRVASVDGSVVRYVKNV